MTLSFEGRPSSGRLQVRDGALRSRSGAQSPAFAAGWSLRGLWVGCAVWPPASCAGAAAAKVLGVVSRPRAGRELPRGRRKASTWLSFGPAACGGTRGRRGWAHPLQVFLCARARGAGVGSPETGPRDPQDPGRPLALSRQAPGAQSAGRGRRRPRASDSQAPRSTGSQQLPGHLNPRSSQGSPTVTNCHVRSP